MDIAKGLGIILVIAGHTFSMDYVYPIYAFHLPLFFVLSGVVLDSTLIQSDKQFLLRQTQRILRPWAILWCISFFVCLCIPQWRCQLSLDQILREFYTANTNCVQNSSIWFLVCMFMMYVLFSLVRHIHRNKGTMCVMIVIACVLLWLKSPINFLFGTLLNWPDGRMPFKMDSAMVALVFFCVGTWNRDRIIEHISNIRSSVIQMVCLLIITCLCTRYGGLINLNAYIFGTYKILYYFIAFFGIYFILVFSTYISNAPLIWPKRILMFYGKNSLLIFGFQSLFIRLYILLFNHFQGLNMQLYCNNPMYHQIGCFLVVTFVLSPLTVCVILSLRKHGISLL